MEKTNPQHERKPGCLRIRLYQESQIHFPRHPCIATVHLLPLKLRKAPSSTLHLAPFQLPIFPHLHPPYILLHHTTHILRRRARTLSDSKHNLSACSSDSSPPSVSPTSFFPGMHTLTFCKADSLIPTFLRRWFQKKIRVVSVYLGHASTYATSLNVSYRRRIRKKDQILS